MSDTPEVMPDLDTQPRLQGSIRNLNQYGSGFIAGDDGRDYFLHWTGLLPPSSDKPNKNFRDLRVQDRVEFNHVPPKDGTRNRRAIKVISLT